MDPVTLALLGILAAWLVRTESVTPRQAAVVGVLAGLAPDLDVLLLLFSGQGSYLLNRGGATHALWAIPVWAALAAVLVSKRSSAPFGGLFRSALAATVVHVGIEAFSIQGVSPLAPLNDAVWRWPLFHTVDIVLLVVLSLPFWLPPLRNKPHKSRAWFGLLAVDAVAVLAVASQLAAGGYAADLAAANGLSADAESHVWPAPLLTTRRSIAVVDQGLAYHAWYDLLSPPETFRAVIPLNDDDPSVVALMKSPLAQRLQARSGLIYAEVWRDASARYRHVFLGDLGYYLPGAPNLAPRLYALTKRKGKSATIVQARWRWRNSRLDKAPAAPEKKAPKPGQAKK